MYQEFVELWLFVASYMTVLKDSKNPPSDSIKSELIQLSSMTPYIVYANDFSLMLRMGKSKEILDSFMT